MGHFVFRLIVLIRQQERLGTAQPGFFFGGNQTVPPRTDPNNPTINNVSESDFDNFALSTNVDPVSGATLSTSNNAFDFSADKRTVYNNPTTAQVPIDVPYRQLNIGDIISIHPTGGTYAGTGGTYGGYRVHINGHIWHEVLRPGGALDLTHLGIWKKSNQTIFLATF
jgi:hypothetical protein